MQRTLLAGLALAAALAAGASWWWNAARAPAAGGAARAAPAATYQCPMHPQVVAGEPGPCPVCGMALAPVEPEHDHVTGPSGTAEVAEASAAAGGAPDAAALGHRATYAPFSLSSAREQLIGVKTSTVEYRELHRDVRTAGEVAFDPELFAALSEHRAAVAAQEAIDASSSVEARQRADGLRRSSALRLALLGVTATELRAVDALGDAATHLLLPGRSAWVYGTVYAAEEDLPRVGHPVVVTSPALPGRSFHGRLVTVGETPRALAQGVRVRALIATPGGGLRRGTPVSLTIQIPLGRRLAVPEDAVLDTGDRRLVFVRHADGRFEPRDVVLGVEAEGFHEVADGLAAGEQVVTAARFLIDSESRFRAAVAGLAAPEPAHVGEAHAAR